MKKEAKKIVSIIMMIFTTGIVNSAAISDPFGLDLALGNIISDIVPISDSYQTPVCIKRHQVEFYLHRLI